MISPKRLILFVALAAASQLSAKPVDGPVKSADVAGQECLAHAIGGYVSRLDKADRNDRRRTPLPQRARGHAMGVTLNEGDVVCGLDIISVPAQSPWIAVINVSGVAPLVVKPGETRQVPKPTTWGATQALKARFDQLFHNAAADRPSASRRAGTSEGEDAAPDAKTILAVREWGPLLIAWPTRSAGQDRTLTIRADGAVKSLKVTGDFIRLDFAHDCPRECTLSATHPEGAMSRNLQVQIIDQSLAPKPDWLGQVTSPEHLALEGGWLLQQSAQEQWSLQAESVLWAAACAYPAVLEPLSQRHFEVDAHQACAQLQKTGDAKRSRSRRRG